MILSDLYNAQAAILGVTPADLTVNGLNLGLMAGNAVRLQAEQFNDFEFQRKTVSLSVDTITGGSLVNAVIYGTATSADVKTVLDVTQLDRNGNEIPLEWTTRAESLERIRDDTRVIRPRYPTDGEYYSGLGNRARRVIFSGDSVLLFPLAEVNSTSESLTLLLETYCYSSDWLATSNTVTVAGGTGVTGVNTTYYRYGTYNGRPLYISLAPAGTPAALYFLWYSGTRWIMNQLVGTLGSNYHGLTSTSQSPAGTYDNNGTYTGTAVATAVDGDITSDIWLTKGFNYILWASVVWLNQNANSFGKQFVARTEGNLAPPTAMADAALAAFITCDSSRFELFRRHGR